MATRPRRPDFQLTYAACRRKFSKTVDLYRVDVEWHRSPGVQAAREGGPLPVEPNPGLTLGAERPGGDALADAEEFSASHGRSWISSATMCPTASL